MAFEPSIIIGAIVSIFGLLAAFGVHVTDEEATAVQKFLLAFLPLAAAVWVRFHVSSPATTALMKARYDALATIARAHGATAEELEKAAALTRSMPPPKLPIVTLSLLLALATVSCTKTIATGGVDAGAGICKLIVLATDPGLAPLCLLAQELADLGIDVSGLPKAGRASACASEAAPQVVDDALYRKALASRAKAKAAK